VQFSVILNPTLTPAEFLEAALIDFGFKDIPESKAQRISVLQDFLWKAHRGGQISGLIVDEAHKLSLDVLEEIRLLGNFESATEKLLQIALVGQSELDDLLNSPCLWQFKQRIARRMSIAPLTAEEVGPYIQHRWAVAGGKDAPFSAEAVAGISQAARGIPRVINGVCDNALIETFAAGSPMVELRHVVGVCRDLHLSEPREKRAAQAAAPAPPPEPYTMKSLERYANGTEKPASVLARFRKKFKSTPRIEIA
jgi:general secretion pathway protein A